MKVTGTRRALGYCLDCLALFGLCMGIVLVLDSEQLKNLFTLIYTVLLIAYFSILTSRLGQGKTIGMRALGLELQRRGGGWLPYSSVILRALVNAPLSAFPILLAQLYLQNGRQCQQDWQFSYLLDPALDLVIVYILYMTINIWLLFFHPRKQTLGDLLAYGVIMPASNIGIPVEHMSESRRLRVYRGLIFAGLASIPVGLAFKMFLKNIFAC